MNSPLGFCWRTTLLFAALLLPAAPSSGSDPPDACSHPVQDFGDAPEDVLAYPGVIGHFPTCLRPGDPGTEELTGPRLGPPPGPTGHVIHRQAGIGSNYYFAWCSAGGLNPGVDSEPDGKASSPAGGPSACDGGPTDCVEATFWGGVAQLQLGQDECAFDHADAGIDWPVSYSYCFVPCGDYSLVFGIVNCGPPRTVYLNVCVDMNGDGDWCDNFACPAGLAYEWAVRNQPIALDAACREYGSPPVFTADYVGPTWFRISISDNPAPLDYPWNGSASLPGGAFTGGETEDYPWWIGFPTPTRPGSWGQLKVLYR
jgi:hypothetical protein